MPSQLVIYLMGSVYFFASIFLSFDLYYMKVLIILHLSEQITNAFTGFAIDKCKRLFTFHIDSEHYCPFFDTNIHIKQVLTLLKF